MEMLTGNVASQATVPTNTTIPNESRITRRRLVRSLALIPAKKRVAGNRTTPRT
jgi:hypothetical protein